VQEINNNYKNLNTSKEMNQSVIDEELENEIIESIISSESDVKIHKGMPK
jgi:hypothetical protein